MPGRSGVESPGLETLIVTLHLVLRRLAGSTKEEVGPVTKGFSEDEVQVNR